MSFRITGLPADSPYRMRFAIYVRRGEERYDAVDQVPEQLRRRMLAIRAFDTNAMMIGHELTDGRQLEAAIERQFTEPAAAYLHITSRRLAAMPRELIAPDLLSGLSLRPPRETIGEGAVVLRAFAAARAGELCRAVERISAVAPFRHMVTPGGYTMSVAMTNCGELGWVTDRRGYRYQTTDPLTGETWPAMPDLLRSVATEAAAAAGHARFEPDACLINRYQPGSRLSLHQDRNERTLDAPIVSISLGLPATFLFGGERRGDRPRRVPLEHADIVVWGGPTRLAFHGVDTLADGEHSLTGRCRINLTFRKAG
jgi:alkylated DNA repair protein (DNA oxidative demethylase)